MKYKVIAEEELSFSKKDCVMRLWQKSGRRQGACGTKVFMALEFAKGLGK